MREEKTLGFKKSEKLYRPNRKNNKVWHSDYASGEITYYGIITEYGFQTEKRFARRSYDNIMIFLKLVMEEQEKNNRVTMPNILLARTKS